MYGFNLVPRTVYVGKMRHAEIHDENEEERKVKIQVGIGGRVL